MEIIIDIHTLNDARHTVCKVISNIEIMSNVFLMWIEAPEIASLAKPGQFIMVLCGENSLLRRPISIHQSSDNKIAILYNRIGSGTDWLAKQRDNACIDILGPLGNGYTIPSNATNLLLVAGGMGIAPLVFLSDMAVSYGKKVTLILGAQKAAMVFPDNLLPAGVQRIVATDDGSMGRTGRVTDLLPDYRDDADMIFACGPAPMYRSMYKQNLLKKKLCQISLEVRMACGMGVCYGCTIRTKQGLRQVCHDGPVFNFNYILWDELVDI